MKLLLLSINIHYRRIDIIGVDLGANKLVTASSTSSSFNFASINLQRGGIYTVDYVISHSVFPNCESAISVSNMILTDETIDIKTALEERAALLYANDISSLFNILAWSTDVNQLQYFPESAEITSTAALWQSDSELLLEGAFFAHTQRNGVLINTRKYRNNRQGEAIQKIPAGSLILFSLSDWVYNSSVQTRVTYVGIADWI